MRILPIPNKNQVQELLHINFSKFTKTKEYSKWIDICVQRKLPSIQYFIDHEMNITELTEMYIELLDL